MKKGFTLIELLVVIAVLAIILLIVVPTVTNILQTSKQKSYDNQVDLIIKATEKYFTENILNIDWEITNVQYISLGELGNNGMIKLPIKDPLNGGNFSNDYCVMAIKDTNNNITYNTLNICP